ncbi:uncharacterized protein LOC26514568 [Drosophila ananassae]|uniref:uncharacterized protein LOC26514568 n=1 Tax=Drosophila ananassae TaxID=7217 RepID=UPI001CFFF57C|nr:uncharacterized protein LOC26514568 [Drosophila ananassae]
MLIKLLLIAALCFWNCGLSEEQSIVKQPYPNDCRRFTETRLLSCPPEFYWNNLLQECQLQPIGSCNIKLPVNELPLRPPPPTRNPENLSELCHKKMGHFVPYPGDCTRFVQCDYLPFVKICPEYLYWNSKLLTCDKICV